MEPPKAVLNLQWCKMFKGVYYFSFFIFGSCHDTIISSFYISNMISTKTRKNKKGKHKNYHHHSTKCIQGSGSKRKPISKNENSITKKHKKSTEPVVVLAKPSTYSATPLTHMFKGKRIYRVEFSLPSGEPCVNYIDDAIKNVVFQQIDGQFTIFSLDGSEIPSVTFDAAGRHVAKIVENKKNETRNVDLGKSAVFLSSCQPNIRLENAQEVLEMMNHKLASICPGYWIELRPFYAYHENEQDVEIYNQYTHVVMGSRFYETLLLALCRKSKGNSSLSLSDKVECISSIELVVSPESAMSNQPSSTIKINSKTREADEGKGFNRLLRATLCIVAKQMNEIKYIESVAINWISAWLLYHNNGAEINQSSIDFIDYINANGKSMDHLDKETFIHFYQKHHPNYLSKAIPTIFLLSFLLFFHVK
jgi:hypothetical protein